MSNVVKFELYNLVRRELENIKNILMLLKNNKEYVTKLDEEVTGLYLCKQFLINEKNWLLVEK